MIGIESCFFQAKPGLMVDEIDTGQIANQGTKPLPRITQTRDAFLQIAKPMSRLCGPISDFALWVYFGLRILGTGVGSVITFSPTQTNRSVSLPAASRKGEIRRLFEAGTADTLLHTTYEYSPAYEGRRLALDSKILRCNLASRSLDAGRSGLLPGTRHHLHFALWIRRCFNIEHNDYFWWGYP